MPGPRLSLSAVLAGAMLLLPAVAVAGAGEGVAAPELRALGELYTATGGPHWKRSDNWLQKVCAERLAQFPNSTVWSLVPPVGVNCLASRVGVLVCAVRVLKFPTFFTPQYLQ